MIEKLSKKLSVCFVKNNIIDKECQEVYAYGSELLVSTMISVLIILVLGSILHCFWHTVCILVPFCDIRAYAGGIHANTYSKCIFSFSSGFLLILLGTEYLLDKNFQGWIIFFSLFSVFIIWLVSPVEDHSRPLNDVDSRERYHVKACGRAIFYEIMIQIIYQIWKLQEAVFVASAINSIMLVLVAGILKNKKIGYEPAYRTAYNMGEKGWD